MAFYTMEEYIKKNKKKTASYLPLRDIGPVKQVKTATTESEISAPSSEKTNMSTVTSTPRSGGNIQIVKNSKAFEDGYDFGDLTVASAANLGKIAVDLLKGVGKLGEGVFDLGTYLVAGGADLFGADKFAKDAKNYAKRSIMDEGWRGVENFLDPYTSIGKTTSAATEGIGQVATLGYIGKLAQMAGLTTQGATAVTQGTMAASTFGSSMSEAYESGATDVEALGYGAMTATSAVVTEMIFGGMGKAADVIGLSKGLSSADDMLAQKVTAKINNLFLKNCVEFGIKAGAEGFEEVLDGFANAAAKKITFMSEEELAELIKDENLLEQFVVGTFTSAAMQSGYIPGTREGSLREANATGKDFITGYTQNEQSVINKEVENRIAEAERGGKELTNKEKNEIEKAVKRELERGYIGLDTIETALGGESYNAYKSVTEQERALKEEIEALENIPKEQITVKQSERLTEAREQLKALDTAGAKATLSKEVDKLTANDTFLRESYNEKTRRGQAFQADLSKYDEKQRSIVQKAVESGILNNTNKTHDFVNLIAKLGADKDISFDFTNNERLKASGFAIEGKTVNGFVQGGSITLNINSAKALNSVVGHEVTHVLEGTEFYSELQKAVFEYANMKGEYDVRLADITELYNGVEDADINAELTADLVGDYLFTDEKFVQQLFQQNRNVFQKVWNEIKYLCKTATAGSQEAKKLLEVQKRFEKVWNEGTVDSNGNAIKYRLSENAETELQTVLTDTTYRDEVLLTDGTPDIMLAQKGVKDLPMVMNASHIRENVLTEDEARQLGLKVDEHTHYHGLGDKLFLKVIDGLDDVELAYRGTKNASNSMRRENYFLLISKIVDDDGNTINVPVYINEHARYNSVFIDTNKIATVFGRNEFQEYINRQLQKKELVRIKKRSIESSESDTPIVPVYRNDASDNNIPQSVKNATGNSKKSLSNNNQDIAPPPGWSVKGSDITFDDDFPIRSDIAQKTAAGAKKEVSGPIREEDTDIDDDMAAEVEEDTDNDMSAEEIVNEKVEMLQNELEDLEYIRENAAMRAQEEIDRLQAEYDALKKKNTQKANDLLQRIARQKKKAAKIDGKNAKKIKNVEERIEKIKANPDTVVRAEQRKIKHEQYDSLWERLIGNTSTWVDKKFGLSYKINTLRRNLRYIVRDENGNPDYAKADMIYDELQGNYNRNEASLNRESNSIKKPYKDLKITKAEDAYIQMLGELRYNPDTELTEKKVKAYYERNKGKIDVAKVDKVIEDARATYDELFNRVNAVLKEQGMKEIPYRKGYFPHFKDEQSGFLGKLLNWKKVNNDIPTSIAGITETFKPNRSWQSFNKQRLSDDTDYSFQKGLDTYVHGALDWIYHIEDIQKRRSLENYIRYTHSEEGVQERIKEIRSDSLLTYDEAQAAIESALSQASNPLNNFVTDLRAGTNILAGKKSSMDRTIEEALNRDVYSTMTNLYSRINANQVAGVVSSALTNFIPITQSWGQVSPKRSLQAMRDTIGAAFMDDGIVEKSDFLTNRLRQEEKLFKTNWDKVSEKATFLMETIDGFTSQTVWRSKYIDNLSKGMSESSAIKDADQFAENVIAGRSRGNMPTIFDSKNLIVKIFTAFQLEVNNTYGYMFKDMPQDMQNETKGKLVKGYATIFFGAWVYNALNSALTGRDAAFDPIGIVIDFLKDMGLFGDEEEEEHPLDAVANLATNVAEELPFVGGLLGGGRIPISSAIPYGGLSELFTGALNDVKEKNYLHIVEELLNSALYVVPPLGGGQIRKTVQGLSMFDDDLPIAGSYTDSGKLRFPVEETLGNKIQAGLFGQYASKNAREYFDRGEAPLEEKQIEELKDLDLPIADYWDYRKGLKKQGSKLADKVDYIAGLDVSTEQKNIMVNNVTTRKEKIDMSNYDDFADFEEFDFYCKYTDKYNFLKENGVSYSDYSKNDIVKDKYDADYTWYKDNPERVLVANAVASDVFKYRDYMRDLDDIKSDKDASGKSISGSSKRKKAAYINNLKIDYGQKIILYRMCYKSDNTYNADIVEYLDDRDDLSYDEVVSILEALNFTVYPDGTVKW